ncbi:MAG: proline iminopeptidase-family hydrolase [Phycisphaerales bacterium]
MRPSNRFLVWLLGALMVASLAGCRSGPCPSAAAVKERPSTGFISVEGGRVWYDVRGSGDGTPILVLHGGPGIPHDYLENLELLGDDRPVIFYDQLGCGRSDRPEDASLWTRERFARELDQVRTALGLKYVIIYGHSWGSILAVDYLTGVGASETSGDRMKGVRGVILAGPALNLARWDNDVRRLIADLGPERAAAIERGEATLRMDTPEFQDAMQEFYNRHVCRLDPWPAPVQRALQTMGQSVYQTLNGPTEFTVTGSLKGLDVTPMLPRLRLPVLYTCGEHDEATPGSARVYAASTPNAEVVVIKGGSHLANWEKPAEYMAAVRQWLKRHGM